MSYITWTTARSTQAAELDAAVPRLRAQIGDAADRLQGRGPVLLGIGASLAAAAAPVWHLRSRGVEAWRVGAGDVPLPLPATDRLVVGVSQSGRSAETLAALEQVAPAHRAAVVNKVPSPIADVVATPLTLGGIEDSYASTVGFTATVIALGMVAEAWDGGVVTAGWDGLGAAAAEVERSNADELDRAAAFFVDSPSADFVGEACAVGTAEAGALLFREVARVPSSAMSTRQYLHGAMESAGAGVHVLIGGSREVELSDTLVDAGHRVVLLTPVPAGPLPLRAVLRLPEIDAVQRAVVEAVLMQGLVERAAAVLDVDIEEFVFHHTDTKVEPAQAAP